MLNSNDDGQTNSTNLNNKPKLLIAGEKLKFILSAVKYLEEYYEVRVDDLTDKDISEYNPKNFKWADIIFCEWLESYVEWFSNNVSKNQKLFIRAHKYEIAHFHRLNVNFDNVDGLITINYFLLELFANVYSVPREKMFLMNNLVETSIYSSVKNGNYRKNLAIVGYCPHYKGYRRALEILDKVRRYDEEFKLYVMGINYKEMWWLNFEREDPYYEDCEEFINSHNLKDSIIYRGWVDRENMFSDIGYVLSVSDIEGSHLSPTEAFADSSLSVCINWPGVGYVYPEQLIFNNVDDMANFILETYNDEEKYLKIANTLNTYCTAEFGEEYFVKELMKVFNSDTHYENPDDYTMVSLSDFKNKYITENNGVKTSKILHDFKNAFIIDDESQIDNIISKNSSDKINLFISSNVDDFRIKNIYQKYASKNVLIYSLSFFQNFDDVLRIAKLFNTIYKFCNLSIT